MGKYILRLISRFISNNLKKIYFYNKELTDYNDIINIVCDKENNLRNVVKIYFFKNIFKDFIDNLLWLFNIYIENSNISMKINEN